MGATVTTFCNQTNIILYTSLSVLFPYYWTDSLLPGNCVNYTVGRVWFTATAEIWTDTKDGFIYFPISTKEAVGLWYGVPFTTHDYLTYVRMTPDEAQKIMYNDKDVVNDDIYAVSRTYQLSAEKLVVREIGFYTNKNKKITITGGPKAVIYKPHHSVYGKHFFIVSPHFEPLKMTVTS